MFNTTIVTYPRASLSNAKFCVNASTSVSTNVRSNHHSGIKRTEACSICSVSLSLGIRTHRLLVNFEELLKYVCIMIRYLKHSIHPVESCRHINIRSGFGELGHCAEDEQTIGSQYSPMTMHELVMM